MLFLVLLSCSWGVSNGLPTQKEKRLNCVWNAYQGAREYCNKTPTHMHELHERPENHQHRLPITEKCMNHIIKTNPNLTKTIGELLLKCGKP